MATLTRHYKITFTDSAGYVREHMLPASELRALLVAARLHEETAEACENTTRRPAKKKPQG
jgi:hypothetical protein